MQILYTVMFLVGASTFAYLFAYDLFELFIKDIRLHYEAKGCQIQKISKLTRWEAMSYFDNEIEMGIQPLFRVHYRFVRYYNAQGEERESALKIRSMYFRKSRIEEKKII